MKIIGMSFILAVSVLFMRVDITYGQQPSLNSEKLIEINKLIEDGWWEDAEALLKPLYDSDPQNPEMLFITGKLQFLNQDYDAAEKLLEKAIELDGNVSDYYLWLGHTKGLKAQTGGILKAPGRAKACKNNYARAIELDSNSIEARYSALQFHMKAPGFVGGDKKIAYAQTGIMAALDSIRGYEARAMLYENVEKDFPKAENELKAAIKALANDTTGNLQPYFWYGYFLNRHDRNAEAESVAFAAMAIDSTNIGVYESLGNLYMQQERYDEAIAQYEKAVAIDSTYSMGLYQIGKLLVLADKDLVRAESMFHKYLRARSRGWWPDKPAARWRLAQIYDKQGKYDLARAELEKAQAEGPKHTKKEIEKLLKEVKKKIK